MPKKDCTKQTETADFAYGVVGETIKKRKAAWKKLREDHRKKFPRKVALVDTRAATKALLTEALQEMETEDQK